MVSVNNFTGACEDPYFKVKLEICMRERKTKSPMDRWQENPKSLRKSIDACCYECGGFNINEVRNCPVVKCPLWQVRPYQNKLNNEETTND